MRVLARQTERKSVNSLFIAKCCIIIFTDYGHTKAKSQIHSQINIKGLSFVEILIE